MAGDVVSFDVHFLGLKDASRAGRSRFYNTMERLTGKSTEDVKAMVSRGSKPMFDSLSREMTEMVVSALEDAGASLEIRPYPGRHPRPQEQSLNATTCPRCGFVQSPELEDCERCGLVFQKWERELVQKEMREKSLEEALFKAQQVREECRKTAKAYLEQYPMAEGSDAGFAKSIKELEIPFLRLESDEGPLLLTSQRLMVRYMDKLVSLPYEIMKDVDVGGGLIQKKERVRMQLKLFSEVPLPEGPSKTLTVHLTKESSLRKEELMKWVYARKFACGVCGALDLDFRLEAGRVRCRCMHCAADHEVDLEESLAVPLESDPS
jgi:hypothetical protein